MPSLLLGAGVCVQLQKGAGKTLAWPGSLISTPGNFTGVKGDEKHHEATKPRAGVDYLSGLGIPDQGLVWSRWGFACCCCGVMVASGRWNPSSLIPATPLPLTAQPSLSQKAPVSAAQPCPWVWAAACTHSPSAGIEGKLDTVPCPLF